MSGEVYKNYTTGSDIDVNQERHRFYLTTNLILDLESTMQNVIKTSFESF